MSRATLKAAIDDYILKADQDYEDVLEALGYIEPEETVKEISKLEERVARGLKRETRFLLDEIAPCATPLEALNALTKIKAADQVDVEVADVLRAEYKKFIPKMSWYYSADMESPVVTKTISAQTGKLMDNWSKNLGAYVKDGTYSQLERLIRDHVDEGKSIDKLTQAILDSGISEERYKARRIAQTETLRMHSYAKNEAMMQNPAVTQKMWRHTGAYRNEPRPNHQAMNGQTVPKDKPFTLYGADGGIYYPMIPMDTCLPPGESINCHCIVQEVVGDNLPRQALEYVPPHEDTGTGAFDYPISQYDRYRSVLGANNLPTSIEEFNDLKYNNKEKYDFIKLDYRRQKYLIDHPERALPNAEVATAAENKFKKYLFGGNNPDGLAKGAAFKSRLGYNANNWEDLRSEITGKAGKYPTTKKNTDVFGTKYEQKMVLYGKNGKPANVVVGWKEKDGKTWLTSAYIKEV